MHRHPSVTFRDGVDGEIGGEIGEVVDLVGKHLASRMVSALHLDGRRTDRAHKEPKSMKGMFMISSVSTPDDPSNAAPVKKPFVLCLAYLLKQEIQ